MSGPQPRGGQHPWSWSTYGAIHKCLPYPSKMITCFQTDGLCHYSKDPDESSSTYAQGPSSGLPNSPNPSAASGHRVSNRLGLRSPIYQTQSHQSSVYQQNLHLLQELRHLPAINVNEQFAAPPPAAKCFACSQTPKRDARSRCRDLRSRSRYLSLGVPLGGRAPEAKREHRP